MSNRRIFFVLACPRPCHLCVQDRTNHRNRQTYIQSSPGFHLAGCSRHHTEKNSGDQMDKREEAEEY